MQNLISKPDFIYKQCDDASALSHCISYKKSGWTQLYGINIDGIIQPYSFTFSPSVVHT